MEIQVGDRAKCKITGFTGIVSCMTTWLNGCIRVGLQPEELKDGKPLDTQYFDIGQVEVVEKGVHTPVVLHPMPVPQPTPVRTPGGPAREGAGHAR